MNDRENGTFYYYSFLQAVTEGPVRYENVSKGGESVYILLCVAMVIAKSPQGQDSLFWMRPARRKRCTRLQGLDFRRAMGSSLRREPRALPQHVVHCGPCWRIKNKLRHGSAKVPTEKKNVLFIVALSYIWKYSDEYVAYVHTYVHHTQAPYLVLSHSKNIAQRLQRGTGIN